MSKIPNPWTQSYANILNCCQTFLSSCCDYDSRTTTSNPSILANRYQPMPAEPELTNPFFKIISNIQQNQFQTTLRHNKITPTRKLFDLQAPINNKVLVPLSSLEIEKQKNAISQIIYSPELTPIPNPALRSMAPSPEPMDPLKKDLEDIVYMFAGFGLEEEIKEIKVLEELSDIEKKLINRSRLGGILRSEARQNSKINTARQNTH